MAAEFHKPGLYKWKRQANPRVIHSSQRVHNDNDIQNWLKKVEDASNTAAELTFGNHPTGRNRGKRTALYAKDEVRYEDEACTEAEELLNQWMTEKVLINDEIDDEYVSDVWKQKAIESNVRHEWDNLLDDSVEEYPVSSRNSRTEKSPDPYSHLYDDNEDDAVASILQTMMKKEFVKDNFKKDLGFEENRPDPRMKMELRHKQVKENREKREKEIERARRDKQSKKDAHLQAKKIVLQEERDKDMKIKKEEQEIQKEMVRIRKQLQADRRRKEEEKLRHEEEALQKEMKTQSEIEKMREREGLLILKHQKSIEERKKFVMQKMSEIQTKQASNNMRLLHQHFTAWYDVILQRRLVIGKSKKNQAASRHYHTSLLQKYFTSWVIWIQQEQDKRQLEEAQNVTRQKMMALLEKAATGQLWQNGEGDKLSNEVLPAGRGGSQSARNMADNHKIDELFAQNNQNRPTMSSQNGPLASKSESSIGKGKNTHPRIPTQAWQVNRKHLNLTADEIASLGGGDIDFNSHVSDKSVRKRFGTQPWMNTHFIVNNFENRYTAQQKILTEQQNQLKEQKRLIQDLQYQQNQQNLKAQLESGESRNHKSNQGQSESDNNHNLETVRTDYTVQSTAPKSISTARSDISSTTVHTNISKTTNISSSNMEERAAERARLRREREEKKRLQEEEALARLAVEEAERKKAEEEEKKAKVEAYREKKRLEKQKEEERHKELEKLKEQNKLADNHYLKSIIKYRGLLPFKKNVQLAKDNEEKASHHYSTVTLKKVVLSWYEHVKLVMEEKYAMADQMRKFLLIKHSFKHWTLYKHRMRILEEKADNYRNKIITSTIITVWLDYTTDEKMLYWQKERQAKEHYLWYLQKKTLLAWRGLPEKLKMDREKEKRREEMRRKVQSMLPDFESNVRKSGNFI
ncbi:hypothetical protein LOTGIDRAFT_228609 [Lottia gigantea]|uniref:Sfi1 spindle body domain-containing protein n=1 Tax=Lottia gigantea TaxID=225164 RepID=V3ZR33_LOTGI|nr:hypothetical protein LOTGIDRAFT_228609 [Lottia gigantea]ESO93853.1 hypothetical protein LOTGIDRAFT_228609 [Lottia gigantea]